MASFGEQGDARMELHASLKGRLGRAVSCDPLIVRRNTHH